MTRLAATLATLLSSSTLGTSAFVETSAEHRFSRNASASALILRPLFPAGGWGIDVTDLVALLCRRRRPRNSWPFVVICRSACR